MQFQVTSIEFDLDCDAAEEELTEQERVDLYEDYIGTFWEADDGDDLVEEITSASGWCINSIDYRIILNWNAKHSSWAPRRFYPDWWYVSVRLVCDWR